MSEQSEAEIKRLTGSYLLPIYPRATDVTVSHGQGVRLWDVNGKEYLDFASGIGVNILGYGHPRVLAAAQDQITKLVHASNLYFHAPQALLAEALCKISGLDKAFFCNSGTEAAEAAIKIARRWGNYLDQKKTEIICFESAYHGRTMGAMSACRVPLVQDGFEPLLEGFKVIPTFDLEALKRAISERTLAVMFEPILGHGGVLTAPPGFLEAARDLCDQHNALLILDEVQSGVGRTGKFFYYQYAGVRPDILTVAKGLAAGFPIGCTLCTDKLANLMGSLTHGSTFGGNVLSTRVALEVVSITSDANFLQTVAEKGRHLREVLSGLQNKHPKLINEVRTQGLMAGITLTLDRNMIAKQLAQSGLLVTSVSPDCIRLLPPLVITNKDIDEAGAIIDRVLAQHG